MVKRKILIVEDEVIIAEDMQGILEKMGYLVTGYAESGRDAMELIEKERPDLVLMDIIIKGEMDGIQTAEEISDKYDIPVVFVTAHSDENTLERARLTDSYGYILKPFEVKDVKIVIENALYKSQAEKARKDCEKWFHSVLDALDEAIMIVDNEGVIKFVNAAAGTLLNVSGSKLTGVELEEFMSVLEGGAAGSLAEITNQRGEKVKIKYRVTPVMNEGREMGKLITF